MRQRPSRKRTIRLLVYCEGQSEEIYLRHLANLLNAKSETAQLVLEIKNCNSNVIGTLKRCAGVSDRGYAGLWAVFDTEGPREWEDFKKAYPDIQQSFNAKGTHVVSYFSSPNIEYWLLLHKENEKCEVDKNKQCSAINRAFGTQFENIDEFKQKKNLEQVIQSLQYGDVCRAMEKSRKIWDRLKEEGHQMFAIDNRSSNIDDFTSNQVSCYDKMGYSTMHMLVEWLLKEMELDWEGQ